MFFIGFFATGTMYKNNSQNSSKPACRQAGMSIVARLNYIKK